MKKIYLSPDTVTVILKTQKMIAGSPLSFDNQGGGSITPSNEDAVGAGMGRRHNNVWGDEEEDDEYGSMY